MLQIFPMCRMEICIKLGLKAKFFMFFSQFINVLPFLWPCSFPKYGTFWYPVNFYQKIGLNFLLKHIEVKFQNTALSRMLASKFLHKLIFLNFCYQILNFLILCKFLAKLWLLVHVISKKSEFLAMKALISEKYDKFGQFGTFFHVLWNGYHIGDE